MLYCDSKVAAIAKPPGLSLATPERAPEQAVTRLLEALPESERDTLLSGGTPLLVHRLDVGTSGLVLLARTAAVHSALATAFAQRHVHKHYLALVWGHPRPYRGTWDQQLGPDIKDRRRMKVVAEGRPSTTQYAVLAAPRHVALLVVSPETGRTHQIRVHAAHAGHPVVGDDLYGGPRHRGIREPELRELLQPWHTLLHAWSLELPSPFPKLPLAPLPAAFSAALAACDITLPSHVAALAAVATPPTPPEQ